MSFDHLPLRPQRIAIVGGGISGLSAAYLLSPLHHVTLYEAAPRLGGHARTVIAGKNGDQPVDTGFIVFNYANYPHLTGMFRDLDVPVKKSDMTFGATIDNGKVEYGLSGLDALFGQRSNMARPAFLRMVRDLNRFNTYAETNAINDEMSVGDLVERLNLGEWFQRYYLLPICGAIWSTPPDGIKDFPARTLVRFFRNHALLSATGQHQWWTVDGGSIEYVSRLETCLRGRGVEFRLGSPVKSVSRVDGVVTIATGTAPADVFDQVIMAGHSDDSLSILADPTPQEKRSLSAVRYQDNQMILHCDADQMPVRRNCWSSWVYRAKTGQSEPAIGVTYWMNRLQGIDEGDPLFVSLNPADPVKDHLIYDQKTFRHPVFDGPAIRAQREIQAIQGTNNTWYAGAWLRHGFHEDGFASAARITREMNRTRSALKVAAE